MKRVLSFLLAIVMLFSLVAGLNVTSSAASNPYDRYAKDANGNWANCTWWAWQLAYDNTGVALPAWGNAGTWYNSAVNAGYNCGSTPAVNAIAVRSNGSYGHVQFVTAVSGSQIYVKEGGYRGTANGYHEGWDSTSEVIGYIYCGGYNHKPQYVSIALEKTSFFSNEHVTYYCSGEDVSYYVISIYNSTGSIIETVRVNPGEYCTRYYNPGTYTVYCEGFNNCGNTFSNTIEFVVKSPTNPYEVKLALEKTSFFTDEHVTYYCNGKEVYYYVLSIYDSKGNVVETVKINPGEYCTRYYSAGTYIAYCEAFNSCGKTFSNNVKFTVKQRCKTHSWNSGVITKTATCTATGTKKFTCTVCGESKTEMIAKTAHQYKNEVIAPTATALGYTLHSCSCGESYIDSYTAPTGKLSLKHSARTANAIKVQWNNVKTAIGYQVQISNAAGNKWSTYASLKAGVTSYTFKKLAAGNNYKFRVRFFIKAADGNNYYSPWSSTLTSPTLPSGTTLTKLTPAKKAFTAQWKKAGVTGYQIQYSTSASFSGAKKLTIKNAKNLKATVKSLSAKETYYVRIRTYKTISKVNYFSTWSKTYKVKTK